MELLTKIVILLAGGLFGSILSALVVYFMTTRNMELIMQRVSREFLSEHLKNKHKGILSTDDVWDITKQGIDDHSKNCGERLEKDMDELGLKVNNIMLNQERHNTEIKNMNGTLKAIAKKMNIIAVDEGD